MYLAELKHVVKAVAGVKLSDHLVDTVFTLFDENGRLSFCVYICCTKNCTICESPHIEDHMQ